MKRFCDAMKRFWSAIEWFWNMVHFIIYKVDYRFHLLFNRINPFMLIHKFPFQKKLYERKGINIYDSIEEAFKRPDIGISSIRAGGITGALPFPIILGVIHLYSAAIQREININRYHTIVICAIIYVVNHYLLFKKDKYLKYFKRFEKMERKEKIKWAWITLGVVLFSIFFFFGSMFFMGYRLRAAKA